MAEAPAAPHAPPRAGAVGARPALSRRRPADPSSALPPEHWRECRAYLEGIELFNRACWWECHEVLEEVWRGAGRHSQQGRFLQGLIQLAAAHLKWSLGRPEVARRMALRALEKLQGLPHTYMGVAVADLRSETSALFEGKRDAPPRIRLEA